MARLEAQEKLLYYPTPISQVQLIHKRLTGYIRAGNYKSEGTLFDPCCGEGTAVAMLAKMLGNWKTYGIEVDRQRAKEAEKKLTGFFHAPVQDVHIDGKCDILFLNPPYDQVKGPDKRQEIQFVRWTADKVIKNGIAIIIVPEMFVGDGQYAELMAKTLTPFYNRTRVYRFTEPEYQAFKQVVIFANQTEYGHCTVADLQVLGNLDEFTGDHLDWVYIGTPKAQAMRFAQKFSEEPGQSILESISNSVATFIGEVQVDLSDMRPLTALKKTNAALVACAGMLNNTIIDGRIIKGSTFKHIVIEDKKRLDHGGATWAIRTKTPTRFTILDLNANELDVFDEVEDSDKYTDFLVTNAEQFVLSTQENFPALYNPLEDQVDYSDLRPPKILPGREDVRGALPQQEERMSATLKGLEHYKIINLICRMSTGKTVMSIGIAYKYLLKNKKLDHKIVCLIPSSPQDLADKWIEEIKMVMADTEVWVTRASKLSDVQEAFDRPGIGFIVIREYYAKADNPWVTVKPAVKRKRMWISETRTELVTYHVCPGCGIRLDLDEVQDLSDNLEKEKAEENNPYSAKGRKMIKCATIKTEAGDVIKQGCGFQFYTRVRHGATEKYPLARYIRDHHARRYFLIIDEAHEFKGSDSNRGYAAQDLISGCLAGIQMTGTFFNGKASGIFYLLYRSSPEFRKLYTLDDLNQFIDDYGAKEQIVKEIPTKDSAGYAGYRKVEGAPREAPGLHPALSTLILPNSIFMNKHDLNLDLVSYSEYTLYVEPDPAHFEAWESYTDILAKTVRMYYGNFDKDSMKKAISIQSFLMYARGGVLDRPDVAEEYPDEAAYKPPEHDDPDFLFPKEIALIKLLLRERKRKRKVLVYVHQMEKRDPSVRILKALDMYGLRGAVMRAKVKKRVDFVREWIARGVDCIITNHQLVKVGIDLVETPTIVWYSLEKQMNTLDIPQANERSHRIHQTKEVEVYYMAYQDTIQVEAAQYVAKKIQVMKRYQGDLTSGLAALESNADFIDDMQKQIVNQINFESDLSVDELPDLPEKLRGQLLAPIHLVSNQGITAKDIQSGNVRQLGLF